MSIHCVCNYDYHAWISLNNVFVNPRVEMQDGSNTRRSILVQTKRWWGCETEIWDVSFWSSGLCTFPKPFFLRRFGMQPTSSIATPIMLDLVHLAEKAAGGSIQLECHAAGTKRWHNLLGWPFRQGSVEDSLKSPCLKPAQRWQLLLYSCRTYEDKGTSNRLRISNKLREGGGGRMYCLCLLLPLALSLGGMPVPVHASQWDPVPNTDERRHGCASPWADALCQYRSMRQSLAWAAGTSCSQFSRKFADVQALPRFLWQRHSNSRKPATIPSAAHNARVSSTSTAHMEQESYHVTCCHQVSPADTTRIVFASSKGREPLHLKPKKPHMFHIATTILMSFAELQRAEMGCFVTALADFRR